MGLFVSTTGVDVSIPELGIVILDPTVDFDLPAQFSAEEIQHAKTLTDRILDGTLVWRKVAAGAVQTPSNYDPEYYEISEENTGTGRYEDRSPVFGDLLKDKSGRVLPASFAGNPKKAAVVFASAFPDNNYAVNITGLDGRVWLPEAVLLGGFVINSQANLAPIQIVYWTAIYQGESN